MNQGRLSAIFGERPTQAQLDVLTRVLFRLGSTGRAEIRAFKPNRKTGKLGPYRGTDQTVYQLTGSGKLLVGARLEYGVRLRHGGDPHLRTRGARAADTRSPY
jgi:hypothetical protein